MRKRFSPFWQILGVGRWTYRSPIETTSEKTEDKVNQIDADKVQKEKKDKDNGEASDENDDNQE